MRIFVVGMPGAGNLGDDLISVMLAQHIFERWPQAEVGILCAEHSNPFVYSNPNQIRFLPMPRRRSWSQFVERIQTINDFVRTSDLILIGGGGLFQDSHYRFTVHKWLRNVLCTAPQGIPAAVVGVGFGPLRHAFSRWYLRKGLARFSVIQVRDEESANIVTMLGYRARIAPDIVAGTSLTQSPFRMVKERSYEPVLGCSIRPWPGLKFETLVSLLCIIAYTHGLSVRVFVFEHAEPHNVSEYIYALKLAKALAERQIDTEVFCYRTVPIERFATAFSNVAMAVASRFHANVLWQKLNVPVLPISYAPKVTSLYKAQGGCVIPIDALSDSYTPEMFQRIELTEPYSLPPNVELLGSARYNAWELYTLAQVVGILEAGYGLARSAAWRLNRLGKMSSYMSFPEKALQR